MKSSVTFLKSLLTNRFVLGNGFLSMFGCVCVCFCLKMGIFYFRRIPESSVCVLWNKPFLIGGFCDDESNVALMESCLVGSLLGFYDYLEIVLTLNFRACYTPKPKYT